MSPVIRISLGLVLLTLSILLIGDMLGLIPNYKQTVMNGRNIVAEALAVHVAAVTSRNQIDALHLTLQSVVERNDEIVSLGVRQANGRLVVNAGEHVTRWQTSNDTPTLTHVTVPLFKDKQRWGQFELVFSPVKEETLLDIINSPLSKLLVFSGMAGFIGYIFFLKKSLRELDPSRVVPAHVKATLDALSEGVIIVDDNERIVLANKTFSERTDIPPIRLIGRKASSLNWLSPQTAESAQIFPWLVAVKEKTNQTGIPMSFEAGKGGHVMFMVNSSPILDAKGNVRGAMATFDDVTQLERKNKELAKALQMLRTSTNKIQKQNVELEVLATRDPLTDCLNRRSFFEKMEVVFGKAKTSGGELSAIMGDIDHFKSVNDQYGHAKGDQIIKRVADLMGSSLRGDDAIGRYGGEEFCIYLVGMNIQQATTIAERIRKRIENSGSDILVTSSFGVSSLALGAATPADLINQADQALYLSKETGRNRVTSYDQKEEIENWLSLQVMRDDRQARGARMMGLPDMSEHLPKIKLELDIAKQRGTLTAILLINIDRFKGMLHTIGEEVCNELLSAMHERIQNTLRYNDVVKHLSNQSSASGTVTRVNREEFLVMLTDLRTADEIKSVSRRLMGLIAKPFNVKGNDVLLTCSVGISIYPEHSESPAEIVNKAAIAMFEASRKGRNQLQIYNDNIVAAVTEAASIESKLSNAIERDEFHLQYQPRVDLQTGCITSVEALLRWEHPELGQVSPVMFIPVAEDTGFIVEIGKWVLLNACKQIKAWHDQGIHHMRVSINLSPKQLMDGMFLKNLKRVLADTNVEPDWIELEITETAIMENRESTHGMLKKLKAMGVHLAIDDFGTGYSSLSYLKHFPVDVLKIDKAFIVDIEHDNHDQMLVSVITEMAHRFSLKVVAEGVETQQQMHRLQALNCDEIQGFIFKRPMLAEQLTDLMRLPREEVKKILNMAGDSQAITQAVTDTLLNP